jgi:hypothetical protein
MTNSEHSFGESFNFPETMPLPLDQLPGAKNTNALQQPPDSAPTSAPPHRVAAGPAASADTRHTALPRRRASDGVTGLFARFSLHRRRSSDVMPELDSGGRPLPPAGGSATGVPGEKHHVVRLLIRGFNNGERGLLEGIVRLSQRHPPQLNLVVEAEAATADFVMIDGADPEAVAWAEARPRLTQKNVIWIDSEVPRPGQTESQRPVPWLLLPTLLAHAIEQLHGSQPASATAELASAAPAAEAPVANSDVAAVCGANQMGASQCSARADECEHG